MGKKDERRSALLAMRKWPANELAKYSKPLLRQLDCYDDYAQQLAIELLSCRPTSWPSMQSQSQNTMSASVTTPTGQGEGWGMHRSAYGGWLWMGGWAERSSVGSESICHARRPTW